MACVEAVFFRPPVPSESGSPGGRTGKKTRLYIPFGCGGIYVRGQTQNENESSGFYGRCCVPNYLQQFSYRAEGLKGLLKDGGSKRRAVVAEAVKSAGGKLEAVYFAFGESDAYVIVEAPDNVSAAAVALAANAGGAVRLKTTVLLTPEEVDRAIK